MQENGVREARLLLDADFGKRYVRRRMIPRTVAEAHAELYSVVAEGVMNCSFSVRNPHIT